MINQRARVMVAACVFAAVSACSDGSDQPRSGSSLTPSSAPVSASSAAGSPSASAASTSAAPASPSFDGTLVSVVVRAGKVETAERLVTVARGSKVRLQVTSDVADEVHVHSYDLSKKVPAGGTVTIDFVATIPGTVEVELEERQLVLVELKTS